MSSDADIVHADEKDEVHQASQGSSVSLKRDRADTTSSHTTQCVAPHTLDATLAARLEEKMWRVFQRACAAQRWKRGCACVTLKDDTTTNKEEDAVVVVDPARWNAYWQAYSDAYGDCIDSLGNELQQHDGSSGSGVGNVLRVKECYRRVLVRLSMPSPSSSETAQPLAVSEARSNGVGKPEEMEEEAVMHEALVDAARHFGALEHVKCERGIHSLQFTTLAAAALFQQWVKHVTLSGLLSRTLPCSNNAERVMLVAKLAPADPRCLTAQLLLGPRLRLSTPYAKSLFCGMFDAKEVRYEPAREAFLVLFDTVAASRIALHALQYSLWSVFHLTLHFA